MVETSFSGFFGSGLTHTSAVERIGLDLVVRNRGR